jgi:hypothetical protein
MECFESNHALISSLEAHFYEIIKALFYISPRKISPITEIGGSLIKALLATEQSGPSKRSVYVPRCTG